jgi:DNA-binding MarR family transcriptional regulator
MTFSDTSTARSPAIEDALAAQRSIFRTLLGATVPDWIQLELTIGQLKTLMAIFAQQRLNVTALAELLRIGKPAASILVDRLVQLGYVARTEDPADRRRTLLTLTLTGSELVATLRQGAGENRFVRWLEQMESNDLAALARGLRALAAVAARENAGNAPLNCAES